MVKNFLDEDLATALDKNKRSMQVEKIKREL